MASWPMMVPLKRCQTMPLRGGCAAPPRRDRVGSRAEGSADEVDGTAFIGPISIKDLCDLFVRCDRTPVEKANIYWGIDGSGEHSDLQASKNRAQSRGPAVTPLVRCIPGSAPVVPACRSQKRVRFADARFDRPPELRTAPVNDRRPAPMWRLITGLWTGGQTGGVLKSSQEGWSLLRVAGVVIVERGTSRGNHGRKRSPRRERG